MPLNFTCHCLQRTAFFLSHLLLSLLQDARKACADTTLAQVRDKAGWAGGGGVSASTTPRRALFGWEAKLGGRDEESSKAPTSPRLILSLLPTTLSSDCVWSGGCRPHPDADPKDPAWAPGQDLRHALVHGLQVRERDAADLPGAGQRMGVKGKKAPMGREPLT